MTLIKNIYDQHYQEPIMLQHNARDDVRPHLPNQHQNTDFTTNLQSPFPDVSGQMQ